MTDPTDRRIRAVRQMKDRFLQFHRNGRWGTCSSCPRDSLGNVYPEACEFTKRYDHQFTANSLADQFNSFLKDIEP